jgi:hypothetical protein
LLVFDDCFHVCIKEKKLSINISFYLHFSRLEKPSRPPVPEPPHQVNGSISDAEPFGTASPGISPSTNNNNPDWANNDAFSSAFDGFSSNKLENVSKN